MFLVKQALELLRGEIKVSSDEGKGSCFTLEFNFPLAEEAIKQATSASRQSPMRLKIDKKMNSVLVVDDNSLILFAEKTCLKI